MKKALLAIVAVWVLWVVLDFIIHGLMLKSTYQETAQLWRPEEEIKYGLMWVVTLLAAIPFVLIFHIFFLRTDFTTGIQYGALYGFASGVSMGYGCYSFMPIPYHLALAWFLGTLVEMVAAGALIGWILQPESPPVES